MGLNYKIKYVRGVDNTVADLLSRDVNRVDTDAPYNEVLNHNTSISNNTPISIESNLIQLQPRDWQSFQTKDSTISKVIEAVRSNNKASILNSSYSRDFDDLLLVYKVLCKKDRVVVSADVRIEEISKHHVFYGYESVDKLTERFAMMYYCPNMANDISVHIEHCDVWQRTKSRPLDIARLGNIVDLDNVKLFEFWSIDVKGPICTTKGGHRYIVVAIDYVTKWVEAIALIDATAVSIAKYILNNIIFRHSVPKDMILLSDQGSIFESKLVKELCNQFGIKKFRSSPYHPIGNGVVERENKSIKELLRPYTIDRQDNWDEYIPQIVFARNTSTQESTGTSPFELVYGRAADPVKPITNSKFSGSEYVDKLKLMKAEIEGQAIELLKKARIKLQQQHEKNRQKVKYEFKIGDLVLMTYEGQRPGLSKKLEAKFIGPYRVVLKIRLNYQLEPVGQSSVDQNVKNK
jgi:hypothetical protein